MTREVCILRRMEATPMPCTTHLTPITVPRHTTTDPPTGMCPVCHATHPVDVASGRCPVCCEPLVVVHPTAPCARASRDRRTVENARVARWTFPDPGAPRAITIHGVH